MSDEISNENDKSRLISLAEAAEIYGLSPNYLRNLIKRGRMEGQKIAGVWLTTPANVETFIKSRQKRGIYRDDISLEV